MIDDLHWADHATLLLTSFLLRSGRPAPLLVLGTYRDTELGRHSPLTGALAELQRDGALDRIGLRGPGGARRGRARPRAAGDDAVAARVHARTDGNAFFAEQVLRGLADSPEVPESVRHAVGVRLSRLSEDANELLAAAAVLGLELDPRALAGTAALEPAAAEAALDEVLRARLLRPRRGRRALRVRARARARGGLRRAQRAAPRAPAPPRGGGAARRWARTATWRRSPPSCSRRRRPPTRARSPTCSSAPGAARSSGSPTRTPPSASSARSRRSRSPTPRTRPARSCSPAATRCCARASTASARGAFDAAARLARRRGDPALLAEAALGFAGLGVAIVDLDAEAIARLEEALEAAARSPLLRSRLQARLAVELYYAPDRTRSEALSAEAVATARGSGDPSALAAALNARHVALWRPDRIEERLEAAADMIAAARQAGEPHQELQARNWRVMDLYERGDMPACREEIARHARMADELRLPSFQWYTPLWAATAAALDGRWAEAERLRLEAQEAGERAGDRNAWLFSGDGRADHAGAAGRGRADGLRLHRGQDRQLGRRPGLPLSPGLDPRRPRPPGRGARPPRRLGAATTSRSTPTGCRPTPRSRRGSASSATRRTPSSSTTGSLPYAGRPATAGRAVVSYGSVDRYLGGLAAVLGRRDEAIAHLRAANDHNAALGCTVWRLHGQRRLLDLAPDDALAAEVAATAAALDLPQLA